MKQIDAAQMVMFEEHEGSLLTSIKDCGVEREACKIAFYLAYSQKDELFWRYGGDFIELAKCLAYVFNQVPGLLQITEGIMITQAHLAANGRR